MILLMIIILHDPIYIYICVYILYTVITTIILSVLVDEVMQDFYHQQYQSSRNLIGQLFYGSDRTDCTNLAPDCFQVVTSQDFLSPFFSKTLFCASSLKFVRALTNQKNIIGPARPWLWGLLCYFDGCFVFCCPSRPHRQQDPTNHGFWNPPCLGPWNQMWDPCIYVVFEPPSFL